MTLSGSMLKLGVVGLVITLLAPVYFSILRENECNVIELEAPPALIGALAPNDVLERTEYVQAGAVHAPESIATVGEFVYTGLNDGRVVKISEAGEVLLSVALSHEKNCGGYEDEPRCGRPLGIRHSTLSKESFFVLDAYNGVHFVDFERATRKLVYSSQEPIDGVKPRFLNDLDVTRDLELLFTDTSTSYGRRDFMQPILQHRADGRLIYLKLEKDLSVKSPPVVLLEKLVFANGVQLLDEDSVLVAELGKARILRHFFSGAKKGQTEVWADNLPGFPDNIRRHEDGTFWVGLSLLRHAGSPSLVDRLAKLPAVRHFVLNAVPPKWWLWLTPLTRPPHAMVIQFDETGKVVSSMHDPSGKRLGSISEVAETNKYFYFGSFDAKYLGRLRKSAAN